MNVPAFNLNHTFVIVIGAINDSQQSCGCFSGQVYLHRMTVKNVLFIGTKLTVSVFVISSTANQNRK